MPICNICGYKYTLTAEHQNMIWCEDCLQQLNVCMGVKG